MCLIAILGVSRPGSRSAAICQRGLLDLDSLAFAADGLGFSKPDRDHKHCDWVFEAITLYYHPL